MKKDYIFAGMHFNSRAARNATAVSSVAIIGAVGALFVKSGQPQTTDIKIVRDPITQSYNVKFAEQVNGETVLASIEAQTSTDDMGNKTNNYYINDKGGQRQLKSSLSASLSLTDGKTAFVTNADETANPLSISLPDGQRFSVKPGQKLISEDSTRIYKKAQTPSLSN